MRTLIEPAGGIQGFKNGLLSIALTVLNPSNYSVMKHLFVASTAQIYIQSILKPFVFKPEVEEGSNKKPVIDSALYDFQIFLTRANNGEIEDGFWHALTLRDTLFFVTGFDRIPAYGMPKLIVMNFDKQIELPKISKCALSVTLPVMNIEKALKILINFRNAFGNA